MVHIIDNYYALSNNYGYTVARNTGKKDKHGEPVYATIGYCGKMKEVLALVLNDVVHARMEKEEMELKQALDFIREQTDRITKALEGIEV